MNKLMVLFVLGIFMFSLVPLVEGKPSFQKAIYPTTTSGDSPTITSKSSSGGDACLTSINPDTGQKMDVMTKTFKMNKNSHKFTYNIPKRFKGRVIIKEDVNYIYYAYVMDGSKCLGWNPITKRIIKPVPHTSVVQEHGVLQNDWWRTQYQGAVRPQDDEKVFRETGVTSLKDMFKDTGKAL